MSKLIDIRKEEQRLDIVARVEAMDVKDKVVFVFMKDGTLQSYFGDKVWEDIRKLGARSVIFAPDHIKIEAFTDEELAVIGLKRIEG